MGEEDVRSRKLDKLAEMNFIEAGCDEQNYEWVLRRIDELQTAMHTKSSNSNLWKKNSLAPVCEVEGTREGNRYYDYCLQLLYSFKKFSSSA